MELCVAMAILLLIVTIFAGNIMARECIYFNGDTIQIEKAFQKPRTVRWQEIRKIDGSFDNMVNLYLSDGTKILTVGIGMVNYSVTYSGRNALKRLPCITALRSTKVRRSGFCDTGRSTIFWQDWEF